MKSFTLALAFALLTTGAAFATPSLKGDITVNADIVTVGDMFDGAGELSETAIFRAPSPGTIGLVPLSDVTAAAKLIGLTGFDNVGYTRVRVTRPSTVVDAAMLGGLIGAELAHRGVLDRRDHRRHAFRSRRCAASTPSRATTPATLTDLRYNAGTPAPSPPGS